MIATLTEVSDKLVRTARVSVGATVCRWSPP